MSGFNLGSFLQTAPGMGLFPSGRFPESLSCVGPPLPTIQALAERPSSISAHF